MPHSTLWTEEGNADGGVTFAFVFWLAASAATYLAVQGSNPGYIEDEAMSAAEADARGLLKGEDSRLGMAAEMIGDSDEEALTSAPRTARSRRQRPGYSPRGASAGAASSAAAEAVPAAQQPGATLQRGGRAAPPRRDAFGAPLGARPRAAELAELGLTEEEIEAEVDAEVKRRLASDSWLNDEQLEAAGPAPPPREGLPVRAHFCKVSQRYVHGFDHYCGVLATPVGERNHCRFWWFLLAQSATIGAALGITHSAFQFQPTYTGWWSANGGVFALALTLWILLAFAGGMLLLHSWLAITGSTSYELFKGPRRVWYLRHTKMCDYPFSKGPAGNLQAFCCLSDAACVALYGRRWRAQAWAVPGRIVRDSDDVIEHCWENRYWSCC